MGYLIYDSYNDYIVRQNLIVEQTKETGSNKKEFVINLLKELFLNNSSVITEHKLEALNLITNGVVSESIDIIIKKF